MRHVLAEKLVVVRSGEMSVKDAVRRLEGMFLEDPGTCLSVVDAARLSGLERSVCREICDMLTERHFLKRGRNGTFSWRHSDSVD